MKRKDVDSATSGKERIKGFVFTEGMSVLFVAVLSLIFTLISNGGGLDGYWNGFLFCLLLFGAPGIVAGVLMLFPFIDDGDAFKYGAGWYYASILLTNVLFPEWMGISEGYGFLISGLIAGLVCVIIYIRLNK